jgi:hypothetical protein
VVQDLSADDPFAAAPSDKPPSGDSAWGAAPSFAGDWSQSAESDAPSSSSWSAPVSRDEFGNDESLRAPQDELPAWPASQQVGLPHSTGEAPGAIAGSSAWQQPTVTEESPVGDPDFTNESESFEPATAAPSEPAQEPPPTSFIERYSHMFTDDEPEGEEAPPAAKPQELRTEQSISKPRSTGIVRPSDTEPLGSDTDDEEESIEQYMAKLLERVRGESSSGWAAAVAPPVTPSNAPAAVRQGSLAAQSAPLAVAHPAPLQDAQSTAAGIHRTAARELVRSKASAAPATDLGALRALANETARMAISRHELRKLRRNAVTKVIVSTLAGMTSLWLMLDSPDWRNIQFITACVSLLVAAYWAGETYRTMVESFREAAYDATAPGWDDSDAANGAELPIDVDADEPLSN